VLARKRRIQQPPVLLRLAPPCDLLGRRHEFTDKEQVREEVDVAVRNEDLALLRVGKGKEGDLDGR
jgi:hypothetical protein